MQAENINDLFGCEKIIPPFLGELGYEVRHFVAYVEPWLRSGWKLISKRPALYPSGTTISSAELFAEINNIKLKYNAEEVQSNLCVEFSKRNEIPTEEYIKIKKNFEADLRETLRKYIDRPGRPITLFDIHLTSGWNGVNEFFLSSYHGLRPSYKPEAFEEGYPLCPNHIGVQFRSLKNKDAHRNSDTQLFFRKLTELSKSRNIPLLVYGEPLGCEFPVGCLKASDYHSSTVKGLAGDLTCLKNCMVMFSPDSGWSDLMGWLQVPTLIMKLSTNYTYLSAIPFDAIIGVYDENRPIDVQFEHCISMKKGDIQLTTTDSKGSHIIPGLFDLNTIWQPQSN